MKNFSRRLKKKLAGKSLDKDQRRDTVAKRSLKERPNDEISWKRQRSTPTHATFYKTSAMFRVELEI